jgi:hypothetical protein
MQVKIDQLCIKREQLKKDLPAERRVLGARKW